MTTSYGLLVLGLYYVVLGVLAVYGVHRLVLLFRRRATPKSGPSPSDPDVWPHVTVQLPLYNERFVGPRLLRSVAELDYPADRIHVQVLDDSTDDTREIMAAEVAKLAAGGLDVVHLHRADRRGFKAGALAAGLRVAKGDLIAVFDADFVPTTDFLRRLVPELDDPRVGMVQARWGHLNRHTSLLTETQAILLDGHFAVEHDARFRSGCLFNFNGTAGIWRRAAIDDAGGWTADTLTEDLDLSYRAQLAGWRFVYRHDVVAPAELPEEVDAFKSQQHRWAKGSIQTMRKLLGPVLAAPLPLHAKLEALIHLTANLCYPLLLLLGVLIFPAMYLRRGDAAWKLWAIDLPLFGAATLSVLIFYLVSQRHVGQSTWRQARFLPAVMATGMGISLNNSGAVLEGFVRDGGVFRRTPKRGGGGSNRYRLPRKVSFLIEGVLASYFIGCFVVAAQLEMWHSLPFLYLFMQGYTYIFALALAEPLGTPRERLEEPAAVAP